MTPPQGRVTGLQRSPGGVPKLPIDRALDLEGTHARGADDGDHGELRVRLTHRDRPPP